MNLLKQAKKAPQTPGVYIFQDKKGRVLYVGRATNLRRRVLQYFQRPIDSRIREMVGLAHSLKFKKTKSVLEAIILEANLIKKYWPKYNVKDRDNRSFIYIIIPKAEYPRPYIVRGKEIENWKLKVENFYLFGPYQSLSLVKNALKIIRRIFPYSTCKICGADEMNSQRGSASERARFSREARKSERAAPVSDLAGRANGSENLSRRPFCKPCFDYQIGLCPGLCIGAISKKDYQKNIKNLILFLKGERKKLIEKLKKENPDKIKALQHIQDVALISADQQLTTYNQQLSRIEGYDVSHLTGKETYGSMVVFINAKPDKTQYRLFKIKSAKAGDDLAALKKMITRRFKHKEWQFPDLILIDGGRPQINYIAKTLKELFINIPLVGISKYGGDELVFPKNVKKSTREIIQPSKNILLKTRDEAHRFALKSSRRKRLKII